MKLLTLYIISFFRHLLSSDQDWKWIPAVIRLMNYTYFHCIIHQIEMQYLSFKKTVNTTIIVAEKVKGNQ